MSLLTHLECSACAATYSAGELRNLCPACGKPLLARYDLVKARKQMRRDVVTRRQNDLWRYHEMLPNAGWVSSLGEGMTPLIAVPRLAAHLGLQHVYVKDESSNPTGSFKARGLAVAVAMAHRLGARRLCLPSAGNAGSAAAAYAAAVGMPVHVFVPDDTPKTIRAELAAFGATVHAVQGHIGDAGRAMRAQMAAEPTAGWFDLSTMCEPYRVEGKKTMGYELAEQFHGRLPAVVIYPAGGGTGLIGMWKAFDELEALGWIRDMRPRMIAVQAEGCAPIVAAFEAGLDHAEPWPNPHTSALGLRVPAPIGDALMLRAVRESEGRALAVSEAELAGAVSTLGRLTGIYASPEGAATLLGLQRLVDERSVSAQDRVVLFNTGSGLKY